MENSNLEIKKYESYLTEDEENESQNEIQGNNERKSITSNHSAVSSSSYHTAQSIYTQNFKPFSIKLSLKKKTSISKIVKRKVVKDERIFILNVEYKSHDEIFDWVIYKSYREIKEVLINIHSNINNFQNTKTVIDDQQTLKKIKEYIRINQRSFSKGENILGVLEIMNNLLPSIRDKVFFLEFLEISRHSFDCFNDGNKPKEGYILKRNGNSRSSSCLFKIFCCCLSFCPSYSRRWFVLKDEMICYLEDSASDIGKEVFWFDQEILITRNSIDKLNLINGSRVLTLKFKEQFEREIWFDSINKAIQAYKNRVKNEYNSFANEKIHNYTKFFVDAEDYFSDLYDKILAAKDTIFIAGWWVSPEVFLKRPVHIDNTQYRLMDILKLKAEEGVKIHLLIYKEVRIALTVDSSHTKDVFNNLHENIKVTRHPKNRLDLLWSHHEKIVIIDQKVGYVGGIDLCWGRFDNKNHQLSEEVKEDEVYLWPGIEYNNSRLKDMINVAQYKLESVERLKDPRMPWHDVSVYLEGPVVSDLCRHFVERWNFARTYFQRDKKHTIIYSKNQYFYILVKKTSITASTMYNNREKNDNNVPSRNIIEKKEIDNLKKQGKYLNTSKVNSTNIDSGITSPLLEENDLDYNYRCLNNKYRQFPPTTTNLTNTNINRNVFTHLSSHKREFDTIQTIHSIDSYENQEFTERKNRDKDDEANCYPSYESDLNSFESKKAINNPINEVYEIKRDSDIKEPRVNLSKKRNTVDHSQSKTHSNSSYSKISNKLDRTSKTEIVASNENANINLNLNLNDISKDYIKVSKKDIINNTSNNNVLQERPSIFNKLKGAFKDFKDKLKNKTTNLFNRSNIDSKKEELMDFKITSEDSLYSSHYLNSNNTDYFSSTCQVLRSATDWSVGLDNKTENSILKAYYNLIDNSKHYILIENQFFISKSFTDDENILTGSATSSVINEIALHIRRRIERAFEEKKKFRVFIFIPLLPAFPGEVHETTTLQIILKYTYRTISRNRGLSLIEKLYQLMQDGYEDYIHFFSLRTHGLVNNIPKTSLIYVHSKIMIVDDQVALIGSANINDRSMLGSRDSEVAVVIQDSRKVSSRIDGQVSMASHFAFNLRIQLFKEHLGEDQAKEIFIDPLDDRLFKMMKGIARSNSLIYREIFNVYPDDHFVKFTDLQNLEVQDEEELKVKYEKNKGKIIGHLVDFPLYFLKEENLNRSYFSKEIIVPIKNFV